MSDEHLPKQTEDSLVRMAQALRALQAATPAMIEMAALEAKLKRYKFDCYVKQGFTESQALELIKGPL